MIFGSEVDTSVERVGKKCELFGLFLLSLRGGDIFLGILIQYFP